MRGLQQGRLYSGDGRSDILDFTVNGRRGGEDDVALRAPGPVIIEALVAASLEPPTDPDAGKYVFVNRWHLKNARILATRTVAVELV